MREPLDRLLRPRSIAVIGGREAEKVLRECRRIGFDGPIYPVNHRRETMGGERAFARLEDIPGPPDAAFIAIPADAAVDAIGVLSGMGAGGAVIYASGFAEIGDVGKQRQQNLLAAGADMALLGPNCYGALNYLDGVALWPDDHGGRPIDRGVAIVTQSGNVGINLSMQTRGVPLAMLASLGNQAKDGVPEVMMSLLRDDRITAIGLFIETVGDVPGFVEAASVAAAKSVPIVVMKTGRSEAAAQIALSHTSSLTGSSAGFDALCDRLAVIQADSLPRFLEYLKFLHVHPGLPGKRAVTLSCSGGEAGILADLTAREDVPTPPFSVDRVAALHAVLGDKVAIGNPLDYHTYIWGDRVASEACFTEALRHDVDIGILALDMPDRQDLQLYGWPESIDAIIAAKQETGRPVIVASSLQETMPPPLQERFLSDGLVPMQGFEDAVSIIGKADWYARMRPGVEDRPPPGAGRVPSGLATVLDEWRSKKALAAHGLPVPEGALVSSATEAVAAAEALGYPVVVKACSPDLAHKTEAGGVALNLIDADQVAAAAERMAALSERIIVEKMASGAVCELIVGISRDPLVGPMLMVGAGGVLTELLRDTAVLLLPVGETDAVRALETLAVDRLLTGYRGRKGDRRAVVDAILAIARFAEAHLDRLVELDVNPLIVLPEGQGVVAADALVRWTD